MHVSFEVFPPKTPPGLASLGVAAKALAGVDPAYVSVTYGAGGGQRDNSFAAIDAVHTAAPDTPIAAHLTCVGQSRAEIDAILDRYDQLGVHHVVALRGDPPEGIDAPYHPHPAGFAATAELVAAIAGRGRFEIFVSAYPEKHLQSPSVEHDLDLLAAKVDAGATRAMTQMFFDNTAFLRYRELVAARGIDVELIPGVFPIHSFPAVARFAARCGATIPAAIGAAFAAFDDDEPADREPIAELAADLAARQIAELAAEGVRQAHVYTLNKAPLALAVCDRLGLTHHDPTGGLR